MPREKAAYRENLESGLQVLGDKYGDRRHLLCIKDVQDYTGTCYDFAKRTFLGGKKYISAETFAKNLSE